MPTKKPAIKKPMTKKAPAKKTTPRSRSKRKTPPKTTPDTPQVPDEATREAFIQDARVLPYPLLSSGERKARILAMDRAPVPVYTAMGGVQSFPYDRKAHAAAAAAGQQVLTHSEALATAPTDVQAIAQQCDNLVVLADRQTSSMAILRAAALLRAGGLNDNLIRRNIESLEELAQVATQLRNSLATHLEA